MVGNLVIGLFLEDIAHEEFIVGLVLRIASELCIAVEFNVRNATGGIPRMRGELRRFLGAHAGTVPFDILVIAQDTDCRGENTIRREVRAVVDRAGYTGTTVVAAPAPHIECWYLADPVAIQRINRSPTLSSVPSSECEKDLYKSELAQAFRNSPLGGGVEQAGKLVADMNLYNAGDNVPSLGKFIAEIREKLRLLTTSTR